MAKKLKLEIDFTADNVLLGISCHKKNYWTAFKLNEALNINLKRIKDLPVYNEKTKTSKEYPLYFYDDADYHINFYFLTDNPASPLFPSQKSLDFFLLINGLLPEKRLEEIITKIKKIPNILLVTRIDLSKLKMIGNFLEDLELHMLDVS